MGVCDTGWLAQPLEFAAARSLLEQATIGDMSIQIRMLLAASSPSSIARTAACVRSETPIGSLLLTAIEVEPRPESTRSSKALNSKGGGRSENALK